jgi:hypothetical protein
MKKAEQVPSTVGTNQKKQSQESFNRHNLKHTVIKVRGPQPTRFSVLSLNDGDIVVRRKIRHSNSDFI